MAIYYFSHIINRNASLFRVKILVDSFYCLLYEICFLSGVHYKNILIVCCQEIGIRISLCCFISTSIHTWRVSVFITLPVIDVNAEASIGANSSDKPSVFHTARQIENMGLSGSYRLPSRSRDGFIFSL